MRFPLTFLLRYLLADVLTHLQPRLHGERVVRRRDDGAREVEGEVRAVEGRALEEDGGEARVAVGGELLLALSDQALLRVRVRVRG